MRNQIEHNGSTYSLTSKTRNRLINNDFSDDLTGYRIRPGDESKFKIVNNKYYTGKKSLRCTATGYAQIDSPMIRKDNLLDCLFDIVFNAEGVISGGINVTIMSYDINKTLISSSSPAYSSLREHSGLDSFKKLKTAQLINLPNGTEHIILRISTSESFKGTLYIDSLWLE